MRSEPLPREIQAGAHEPPTDIQMIMHGAWVLAGIAITLAACTAADEADLHAVPAQPNVAVAHLAPQADAPSGNVQDLTY